MIFSSLINLSCVIQISEFVKSLSQTQKLKTNYWKVSSIMLVVFLNHILCFDIDFRYVSTQETWGTERGHFHGYVMISYISHIINFCSKFDITLSEFLFEFFKCQQIDVTQSNIFWIVELLRLFTKSRNLPESV